MVLPTEQWMVSNCSFLTVKRRERGEDGVIDICCVGELLVKATVMPTYRGSKVNASNVLHLHISGEER